MLETFNQERLAAAPANEIGRLLEHGNIIYFPSCPVELPAPDQLEILRSELPDWLSKKNVSYHPESDAVSGLKDDAPVAQLAREVLTTHSRRVVGFLDRVMPAYRPHMRIGTSSFRPMEEQGRNLKPHASNELIHVDAGAYGATNGDRILRFFVNVNPEQDRVWATKGRFQELLAHYGEDAGLLPEGIGRLNRGLLDRMRSWTLRRAKRFVPMAEVLDSSPYDRVMRRFHNYMKDTPDFQRDDWGYRQFRFPPFSAWMVFTDGVSHACLSGRHALVWTALVSLEDCLQPDLAPISVLRQSPESLHAGH